MPRKRPSKVFKENLTDYEHRYFARKKKRMTALVTDVVTKKSDEKGDKKL